MSRGAWLLLAIASALLVLQALWVHDRRAHYASTSVGTAPAGLRGAALLAEQQGKGVSSWRRPLADLEIPVAAAHEHSVLVMTLPLKGRLSTDDGAALSTWLAAGHSLVLQADGESLERVQWGDGSGAGVSFRQAPKRSGTIAERAAPAVWAPTTEGDGAIAVSAPTALMTDVAGDEVVFGTRDVGTVRRRAVGPGVVWLLDGPALTNRWLARGTGNVALWSAILDDSKDVWFDDYHQGLVAVEVLDRATSRWPYTLLLAHLALLWLVGVWSVARPYSRVPAGRLIRQSSVARELSDLARLHAHHNHSIGARASLMAHAGAAAPSDAEGLLDLAKHIAALQDAGRIT